MITPENVTILTVVSIALFAIVWGACMVLLKKGGKR
jgi:hypothetical protein